MTAEIDIINRSLTEIAARQPISGSPPTYDNSAAAVAAVQLYQPAVETLLRQQDFEFARTVAPLAVQAGTPPLGWAFQYTYPATCLRVRQIVPATFDPFDPQPVVWDVGTVSGVRVVWVNEASAQIGITTNAITENEWDSLFTEQMVRYLGSMLAMPVGGRPDFSREMLGQAGGLGEAGRDRDS